MEAKEKRQMDRPEGGGGLYEKRKTSSPALPRQKNPEMGRVDAAIASNHPSPEKAQVTCKKEKARMPEGGKRK